jgi:hypothetical protein
MPVRRRGNKLERWEIALIKAMVADGRWPNDQDILAYFTRPTRSINHRAIAEIRTGAKHAAVKAAAPEELDGFIASWPEVEPETGLSLRGDELLIKAREAMVSAVHSFNSAGLTFRAELFIVTAIIAWTYLLHAWFKREGIDYPALWRKRHKNYSRIGPIFQCRNISGHVLFGVSCRLGIGWRGTGGNLEHRGYYRPPGTSANVIFLISTHSPESRHGETVPLTRHRLPTEHTSNTLARSALFITQILSPSPISPPNLISPSALCRTPLHRFD